MKIICPFTPDKLQEATRAALDGLGRPVEFWDVSSSDRAYFDLLCALWAAAEDFLIVEHDMVPTADMVTEMETCPRWWCVNGYVSNQWGQLAETAFGFTRFRRQLMAAEPDAFEVAAVKYRDLYVLGRRWPGTHWRGLDCRFDCVMGDRRIYRQHLHAEPITHLHEWWDYPPA